MSLISCGYRHDIDLRRRHSEYCRRALRGTRPRLRQWTLSYTLNSARARSEGGRPLGAADVQFAGDVSFADAGELSFQDSASFFPPSAADPSPLRRARLGYSGRMRSRRNLGCAPSCLEESRDRPVVESNSPLHSSSHKPWVPGAVECRFCLAGLRAVSAALCGGFIP